MSCVFIQEYSQGYSFSHASTPYLFSYPVNPVILSKK